MGNLQYPENFNMKDLFLNVSLRTCINGSERDFTGRKTFNTSFFKKNIGFGITDISIEVNTSLQPSIEITFKDLYGNTLFGTQKLDNESIDTSVLFDWPPPKFIFSFKGYLGSQVTWMLNLKSTNISYVASDGSYEIKCNFVPNQWGFMADLPMLYLLACKKLRYDIYENKTYEKVSENCIFEADSIYSYIRIGKRVETKTTEETKDFELLLKQMGSIKYGLSSAVCGAKIITLDDPIIGVVNNIEVNGFTNIKVTTAGTEITSEESLIERSKNSANNNRLDFFLQYNIQIAELGNPQSSVFESFQNSGINGRIRYDSVENNGKIKDKDLESCTAYKAALLKIIDANIDAIDNEIKRRVYSSTKSQISKLTIGEVFRQIARDSAFILGSILQAGFDGYGENKGVRDSQRKNIIGKCFPLYINDKGEEVPAIMAEGCSDVGVEKYEMDFVDKFIAAIGDGISENLESDDVAAGGEDTIQNRINNLEAIQPNPYKSFYSNIAENILIRSGIIAFITRSSDPSKPGDFPKDNGSDRDDSTDIIALAESDMENLSKEILGQMSFEDKESLKRFCKFFDRFISDSSDESNTEIGEQMRYFLNEDDSVMQTVNFDSDGEITGVTKSYSEPVPEIIMDAKVNVGDLKPSGSVFWDAVLDRDKPVINTSFLTLRQIVEEIIPSAKGESVTNTEPVHYSDIDNLNIFPREEDEPAFYNASFIDKSTLVSKIVFNNGLYWTLPTQNKNDYVYVLFENSKDAIKAKEISVPDAYTEEELEGKGAGLAKNDPVGFVPINSWRSTFFEGEVHRAVEIINERIEQGNVIDYSSCKKMYENTSRYVHPVDKGIQKTETKLPNEITAKNLCYAVYTHLPHSEEASSPTTSIVFAPFMSKSSVDDVRPRNQRIAIKTMCKKILDRFDEIEAEKNETIATVLGKANESRNALYKQMHTIFHQWQIIASTISGQEMCKDYTPDKDTESLAKTLEREFGLCENHRERGDGTTAMKDLGAVGNTMFVYDYPLCPVSRKKVDVKRSIINIEPLYNPNANTTVLNIIQQICTKNNFVFVPFPGDANSDNINEIYKPYTQKREGIMNYFHVIFTPTPESRTKLSNDGNDFITEYMENEHFQNSAISIKFGSVENQIIKSVNVGTDSTKPTAESILNLQRLVDKENSNHKVSMDCSMLPVYEGRSYKAKIDMIGNAQVYPMQYFYIENMKIFGGLYQIMKVNHNITPNDMSTSVEGIRMRFDTKGGYGGIPPITLDDLENLGDVKSPRVLKILGVDLYYEATGNTSTSEVSLSSEEISQDFINFAKGYEISSLSDMDTFVYDITKGKFSNFVDFFNSTQALSGKFKRLKHDNGKKILNSVGAIASANVVLFDNISNLSEKPNKTLNVLEILIMWVTTLSESMGKVGITEGGDLNYFFRNIYDKDNNKTKTSYNKANNKTVAQCLSDTYFKKRYNSWALSFENKDLFTNIPAWASGQDNIPAKYASNKSTNIVYNCDFNKFRGRGYIQLTWRDAYGRLLDLLKAEGSQRVKNIINSWISYAGTNSTDALLSVSSTSEWDGLFSFPEVAAIAYKRNLKNHSSTHDVDRGRVIVDLDKNLESIKSKLISIGTTPSWSRFDDYGLNNYLRVAQICSTLMNLNSTT